MVGKWMLQVIDDSAGNTLVAASTLTPEIREKLNGGGGSNTVRICPIRSRQTSSYLSFDSIIDSGLFFCRVLLSSSGRKLESCAWKRTLMLSPLIGAAMFTMAA